MKKFIMAAATVLFVGASAASAATFNFVAMADDSSDANYIGNTELNWADTTFAAGLTIDGITLVASGSNANGADADAFFDKGIAGLGVCSTPGPETGGSGCATGIGSNTADDNVSGTEGGETLTLDFGQFVNIVGITFRNASHNLLTGSVDIVGLGTLGITDGAVTSGAEFLKNQSIFNFKYTGDEFYIAVADVSPVPLPAGGLLLLTGLGALALRRRRKAA